MILQVFQSYPANRFIPLGILNQFLVYSSVLFFSLFYSCKDNGNPIDGGGDGGNHPCPECPCPPVPFPPLFAAPYGSPVWHPDGRIAFNWTRILKINRCTGEVRGEDIDRDSSGFWMINADGSGLRKLLSYGLDSPAWSPDGQWIAFGAGQIYKMRFTGSGFDTTTIVQLTTEGRNFFPAWSADGQWIAYDRSLADASGPAGIWVMRNDGSMKQALLGGAFPAWHPNGNLLIGVIGTSPTSIWTRFVRYDFVQSRAVDTLSAVVDNDNRYPRYSPDGTKIAFSSQAQADVPQVWVMSADGSNPLQLTTKGSDLFSWSPDGSQIVYVQGDPRKADVNNGTLWIMNADGSNKRQLTFNYGLVFYPLKGGDSV